MQYEEVVDTYSAQAISRLRTIHVLIRTFGFCSQPSDHHCTSQNDAKRLNNGLHDGKPIYCCSIVREKAPIIVTVVSTESVIKTDKFKESFLNMPVVQNKVRCDD
jgi:hypothetical protein